MDFQTDSIWFRTFVVGMALSLCFCFSEPAAAQKTVTVRGNVGASFFRAPESWSRTLHSGTDLGVEVGVRLYRGLSVTAHGGFDRFTLNRENLRITSRAFGPNVRVSQGDVTFLSGSLGFRYTFFNDTDAHPYFSTGVGVYRVKQSNRKVYQEGEQVGKEPPATATEMGAHLALGSLFRLDDTYAVFFEPRYIFYDVGGSPSGVGALRYFTLRLGVEVQF